MLRGSCTGAMTRWPSATMTAGGLIRYTTDRKARDTLYCSKDASNYPVD